MTDRHDFDLDLTVAPLWLLASTIRYNWANVNYAAAPYLDAMAALDSIDDNYGADTGRSIVAYFLSNASGWRGDVARATKGELKRRLGVK
jgi:hypothetical protein